MDNGDPEESTVKRKTVYHLSGGKPWGFTVKETDQFDGIVLVISKLEPEGKAATSGVQTGDVLISVNGNNCTSITDAQFHIQEAAGSNFLDLGIWREEESVADQPASANERKSRRDHTTVYTDGNVPDHDAASALTKISERELTSPPGTNTKMDNLSESFLSSAPFSTRRSSLYASQPIALYRDENISYTKSSSRTSSRQSMDASNYPVCGLPSSTLYRKSVSNKKTAFVEPLPSRGYDRPLPPVPLPESSSYVNISHSTLKFDESPMGMEKQSSSYSTRRNSAFDAADAGTPAVSSAMPSSSSGLKPKNQRMMDLLHSHRISNNNVFHATPSWSQTESPVITPIMQTRSDHNVPRHSLLADFGERVGIPPEEVTELSATIRGLPLSRSTQQCSENFHNISIREYGSDGLGTSGSSTGDNLSSGLMSSRSSFSSDHSLPSSNLNGNRVSSTLSGDRMKSRKNLTNASISSDELDDSASLKTSRSSVNDRMQGAMPAFRAVNPIGDVSREKGNNAHLTTVKEVRTFPIRPNLDPLKESSGSSLNNSPSSVRSSASSTPEEFQHIRNASMDSSVSWQSNSTTSSGYSSTTLSSSNLLADKGYRASDHEDLQRRDRANTTDASSPSADHWPRSTAAQSDKEDQSDVPVRSMSVSEMVRSFSGTKLLPRAPNPPPKPRYTHHPASGPSVDTGPGSSPPKPKSVLIQHGQKSHQPSRPTQVTFASMEDVRVLNDTPTHVSRGRRSSTAETPSIAARPFPGDAEPKSSPVLKSIVRTSLPNPIPSKKPALSVKPNTVFRTGVHGVVLGPKNTDIPSRKDSFTEEDALSLKNQEYSEIAEPKYVPKYRKSSESAEKPDTHIDRPNIPVIDRHAEIEQHVIVLSEKEPVNENMPPKESELNSAKQELIERLSANVALLREEQTRLQEEIDGNDRWGDSIFRKFSLKATKTDLDKYAQHVRELEEITSLTMSLASRIDRIELSLGQLNLPADDLEASTLKNKRSKLVSQQEEATYLQQGIERRRKQFQSLLSDKYFDCEEYEEYTEFFGTKATLLRDSRNLADKIRLGEEKLYCLLNSNIPS